MNETPGLLSGYALVNTENILLGPLCLIYYAQYFIPVLHRRKRRRIIPTWYEVCSLKRVQ